MNLNSMDGQSNAIFRRQSHLQDARAAQARILAGAARDGGGQFTAAGSSLNFSHVLAGEIQKGRRPQRPRQSHGALEPIKKL